MKNIIKTIAKIAATNTRATPAATVTTTKIKSTVPSDFYCCEYCNIAPATLKTTTLTPTPTPTTSAPLKTIAIIAATNTRATPAATVTTTTMKSTVPSDFYLSQILQHCISNMKNTIKTIAKIAATNTIATPAATVTTTTMKSTVPSDFIVVNIATLHQQHEKHH
jgi:hypothetical protein